MKNYLKQFSYFMQTTSGIVSLLLLLLSISFAIQNRLSLQTQKNMLASQDDFSEKLLTETQNSNSLTLTFDRNDTLITLLTRNTLLPKEEAWLVASSFSRYIKTRQIPTDTLLICVFEDQAKTILHSVTLQTSKKTVVLNRVKKYGRTYYIQGKISEPVTREQTQSDHIDRPYTTQRKSIVSQEFSIVSAFEQDAKNSGVPLSVIHAINTTLRHVINFNHLKVGDRFALLYTSHPQTHDAHTPLYIKYYQTANHEEKEYYYLLDRSGKRNIYDSLLRKIITKQGIQSHGTFLDASFSPPLHQKLRVSSPFGYRFHPILRKTVMHTGVDLRAHSGTSVYTTYSGIVLKTVNNAGSSAYGRHVIILHNKHYKTLYAHLSRIKVKEGSLVKAGSLIAYSGNTGRSTGPHLHYELRYDNRPVNPLKRARIFEEPRSTPPTVHYLQISSQSLRELQIQKNKIDKAILIDKNSLQN